MACALQTRKGLVMEKHPQLAEKLKLLYLLQLNQNVRTHADLSRELGISKQAITKWCRGGPTSRGNAIPKDQVALVASLLGINPTWFSLPLNEFEKRAGRLLKHLLRLASLSQCEFLRARCQLLTSNCTGEIQSSACWMSSGKKTR